MKHFVIVIAPRARKQIDKLLPNIKSRIADVLYNVLANDPFKGKALKAELKGLYSYRVADYRIIYSIIKNELIIQVIKIMQNRGSYD